MDNRHWILGSMIHSHRSLRPLAWLVVLFASAGWPLVCVAQPIADEKSGGKTDNRIAKTVWKELPPFPNPLGVAGPFVGVHENALLVAGGANFPAPVWDNDKQWVDDIYVLQRSDTEYEWTQVGNLPSVVGYGASVSTREGVLCLGGNNADQIFSDCFRLTWNSSRERIEVQELPSLPMPLAHGQACVVGDTVYLAGGQTGPTLGSSVDHFLTLDLSQLSNLTGSSTPRTSQPTANSSSTTWKTGDPWPFPSRSFNLTVAQNNGFDDCVYVIGGRYEDQGQVRFLDDCWEYNPRTSLWSEKAKMPTPLSAGTAVGYSQSHIVVLGGDDGEYFGQADALKDEHPGFAKQSYAYHTITDTWIRLNDSPLNQVTTTAIKFDDGIVIPTGEVRPRVRTDRVWKVDLRASSGTFGTLDYIVLALYLASLVAIGVVFSRRSKNTDDYFRGSGNIPWWAAGCSIFATMLSSLTFTGVPSKAFAQDWVYAIGNFMIPVVAFVAVFIALPFYRRIDATSAYEYLEQRFHVSIRVFGSLSFSTFHLFRMAIVMSLTALALAVATPLTPAQSVVLMGVLSIVYCTLGGVSAVIWTDTLQTFVLLGGALLAIVWMLSDTGLSLSESWQTASNYQKLNVANWTLSPWDTQVALWAVVIGSIGQNLSSYTADQAVVQRYMTTRTQALAARAIWTNAILTIPATILFFGIGTSLFFYYHAHPDRLDPTIHTDQIFPLFISRELPIGLSGLIVAAIFAAAQSTVSTSMNSVATTLLTDCIQPWRPNVSERTWLRVARVLTVLVGIAGTWIALAFVDPGIRSLFDQFIKVIGLFMGVLGGLFVLGTCFPRANTRGAWAGVVCGATIMIFVWKFTSIQGYLYTAIGITTCVVVGVLCSDRAKRPAKA